MFMRCCFALFFLKFHKPLKNSTGRISATIVETIAILCIADFICWSKLTMLLRDFLFFVRFPLTRSIDLLNVNYIASSLPVILLLMSFALEKGFFSRLLTQPSFVFLGELSFSIFMCHQLFFRLLGLHKNIILASLGEIGSLILLMISVVPLSFLLYKFIENPIRRKMRVNI